VSLRHSADARVVRAGQRSHDSDWGSRLRRRQRFLEWLARIIAIANSSMVEPVKNPGRAIPKGVLDSSENTIFSSSRSLLSRHGG
jgi:hypothetical protein